MINKCISREIVGDQNAIFDLRFGENWWKDRIEMKGFGDFGWEMVYILRDCENISFGWREDEIGRRYVYYV